MKVGWVGLGRVGLPCALVLAKHVGVIGYDISGVPYRAINDRRTPDLTEPGLADLIEYNERLRTADSIDEVVAASDLVFVAVQTPHAPEYDGSQPMPGDRRDFDYTALRTVVAQLAQAAYAQERHITVVVESTVLPGTSDRVLRPLLNEYTTLVYNPFLIAMGTVIEDFTRPEMVIIGADQPGHVQPLVALYNFVHDAPIHYCSIASAELLKCAYNTFISAKIVFANALMEICHSTAADVDEVTRGLALATDRVVSAKYLSGGMGDGGSCLPPGELIITERGPRSIETINVGDRVLTIDGNLRPVVRTWQRDYDGPLVSYAARGLPAVRMTAEHPVMTRRDLRQRRVDERRSTYRHRRGDPFARSAIEETAADKLTADHLVTWPDYTGEPFPLPAHATAEYLELAGWYLAEGSLTLDARRSRLTFSLHIDESIEAERIAELLADCAVQSESRRGDNAAISVQIKPWANGRNVRFGNMGLARRLDVDFGHGAADKRLPAWALWSSPKTAGLLLEGMLKGDGHINDHGVSYSTISEHLAWGAHVLLTRLGARPATRVISERPGHQRSFEVRVRNRVEARRVFAATNISAKPVGAHEVASDDWRPVRLLDTEHYCGPVHNLWVADSNTFVTAAGVVHNCHPRDLIAMSWLSEQLDLSYDLFGELVRAREHQTRWLARQVVDQARLRGRGTIVVLGDAYKADVSLSVGSPAVLLAGMIRDIDNTLVVYAVDPVTRTGRIAGHGDAVYVHATPHAAFVDYKFPHGSVVVDPWRKSWPAQHGVTFIPIGGR